MDGDSITRAGAIFIIYLFISVSAYFLLSSPIDMIFDAFENADGSHAESKLSTYIPQYRTVLQIFFAIFLALPLTWFVIWVFHREPGLYYDKWR